MLALLLACTGAADTGDSTTAQPLVFGEPTVEVSPHKPTVLRVRWTTDPPTPATVRYQTEDGHGGETAAQDGEALILGLPADTEVSLTVQAQDVTSETVTATTGSLPASLVSFTQTGDPLILDGYLALAVADDPAVVIVDAEGRVVWWHEGVYGYTALRAHPSVDGTGVWLNQEVPLDGDGSDAHLLHVTWWGDTVTEHPWPYLKHDFLEHADGTLAALTDVLAIPDDPNSRASGLVERAPDGTETVIWSIHDDWTVCGGNDDPLSHANHLSWDPATKRYLVSLLIRKCLLAVDRDTGTPAWFFGSVGGDYALAPDSTPFGPQHGFSLTETGVVLFDNGDAARNQSRAVAYDLADGTATETWSATHESGLYAPALGDAEALPDGTVRVIWNGAGHVQHLTNDGTGLWELRTTGGQGLAYGTAVPTLP